MRSQTTLNTQLTYQVVSPYDLHARQSIENQTHSLMKNNQFKLRNIFDNVFLTHFDCFIYQRICLPQMAPGPLLSPFLAHRCGRHRPGSQILRQVYHNQVNNSSRP